MINMLKKILLILLITNASTIECSMESNDTKATIAAGIIGLGTAAYVIYTLHSSFKEFNLIIGVKNGARFRLLEKAAIILIGAATGVYVANAFYPICKDIIDYAYPSEEQKIALIEAGKRYQVLKAEIDFRNKNLQLT